MWGEVFINENIFYPKEIRGEGKKGVEGKSTEWRGARQK
jgi:hypothetical protein